MIVRLTDVAKTWGKTAALDRLTLSFSPEFRL